MARKHAGRADSKNQDELTISDSILSDQLGEQDGYDELVEGDEEDQAVERYVGDKLSGTNTKMGVLRPNISLFMLLAVLLPSVPPEGMETFKRKDVFTCEVVRPRPCGFGEETGGVKDIKLLHSDVVSIRFNTSKVL